MIKKEIIIGIDPGFARTGYGIIQKTGNKIQYINHGLIETFKKDNFCVRLEKNNKELDKIIKKYKPDYMAIEKLFFAKNTKTALKVAEARGVILLTAIQNKLKIYEFSPIEIKLALTGYGRASKDQIQEMVKIILNMQTKPKQDDSADALAIAITKANTNIY
ncbi:crossover junction endodeoxyribonuclease RuvC [Patescibacteria group bacterium]|nr:crossover junction endodeoxyribonuclease RuvC [Patescibacteria group bacterium]